MLQDGVYVQGALPAGFGYDADEVERTDADGGEPRHGQRQRALPVAGSDGAGAHRLGNGGYVQDSSCGHRGFAAQHAHRCAHLLPFLPYASRRGTDLSGAAGDDL